MGYNTNTIKIQAQMQQTYNNILNLKAIFFQNPTYYEVIKEPIDLDTISDRIETKVYSSWASLKKDVRLLHKNAITYNKNGSQVRV